MELSHILPAIANYKDLKLFLKSTKETCILMDFQLAELEDIVQELKEHNKHILIHIDLIKGLSSDEFGAIYCQQKLKVDGVISTKASVIMMAKKRKITAIQRVFLKDTSSLKKSIQLINKTQPDFLEVLPALSNEILDKIIKETECDVICGGLIQSMDMIQSCLDHGAVSVTTSNPDFWNN